MGAGGPAKRSGVHLYQNTVQPPSGIGSQSLNIADIGGRIMIHKPPEAIGIVQLQRKTAQGVGDQFRQRVVLEQIEMLTRSRSGRTPAAPDPAEGHADPGGHAERYNIEKQ